METLANQIEIRMANMSELPLITNIDLSFTSGYVWKSQSIEDVDSRNVTIQRIKYPKPALIPFQGCDADSLEGMLKRNEVLIVRNDNRVIGFMHMGRDDNRNRLILKAGGLKQEFRNIGIGSIMLESITNAAIKNGVHNLISIVQAKNDPAIRFLTKKGFAFCGFEEFYFPNMEIALFYMKTLR